MEITWLNFDSKCWRCVLGFGLGGGGEGLFSVSFIHLFVFFFLFGCFWVNVNNVLKYKNSNYYTRLTASPKKHSFLSSGAGLDQDEERNTEYLGVNSLFDSKISDRGCSTALEILCNVIPKAWFFKKFLCKKIIWTVNIWWVGLNRYFIVL